MIQSEVKCDAASAYEVKMKSKYKRIIKKTPSLTPFRSKLEPTISIAFSS
jgi:hypothetical protein